MDQPRSLKALSGCSTGWLGHLLRNFVDFGCLALYFKGLTPTADLHRNTSLIFCLDVREILPQLWSRHNRARVIVCLARLAELMRDLLGASSHRQIGFAATDGALCEVRGCRNVCDLCSGGGGKHPLDFFREIWRHISAASRGSSLRGSAQMITCDLLWAGLTITVYYPLLLLCSPSRAPSLNYN